MAAPLNIGSSHVCTSCPVVTRLQNDRIGYRLLNNFKGCAAAAAYVQFSTSSSVVQLADHCRSRPDAAPRQTGPQAFEAYALTTSCSIIDLFRVSYWMRRQVFIWSLSCPCIRTELRVSSKRSGKNNGEYLCKRETGGARGFQQACTDPDSSLNFSAAGVPVAMVMTMVMYRFSIVVQLQTTVQIIPHWCALLQTVIVDRSWSHTCTAVGCVCVTLIYRQLPHVRVTTNSNWTCDKGLQPARKRVSLL